MCCNETAAATATITAPSLWAPGPFLLRILPPRGDPPAGRARTVRRRDRPSPLATVQRVRVRGPRRSLHHLRLGREGAAPRRVWSWGSAPAVASA